jgi:hypothetical protein
MKYFPILPLAIIAVALALLAHGCATEAQFRNGWPVEPWGETGEVTNADLL